MDADSHFARAALLAFAVGAAATTTALASLATNRAHAELSAPGSRPGGGTVSILAAPLTVAAPTPAAPAAAVPAKVTVPSVGASLPVTASLGPVTLPTTAVSLPPEIGRAHV